MHACQCRTGFIVMALKIQRNALALKQYSDILYTYSTPRFEFKGVSKSESAIMC